MFEEEVNLLKLAQRFSGVQGLTKKIVIRRRWKIKLVWSLSVPWEPEGDVQVKERGASLPRLSSLISLAGSAEFVLLIEH